MDYTNNILNSMLIYIKQMAESLSYLGLINSAMDVGPAEFLYYIVCLDDVLDPIACPVQES